jgi:hypothetical protein
VIRAAAGRDGKAMVKVAPPPGVSATAMRAPRALPRTKCRAARRFTATGTLRFE